ncbi:Crp/Fnr family transcriptional regulator [Microvirga roseola]|uniref:Crp/Fnr family transcriptional regulator n=1 Tax=Microvirga roseola TaxID=2883126 RepID=UPI001E506B75|nr:Crp/Fnr family transcriptional regulator [Microvirga roseola]
METAQNRAAPAHPFDGTPRNRILAALPPNEFERIRPHLTHAVVRRSTILQDFDVAPDRVFFIESGLASLQVHTDSDRPVEVGMVGRKSLVGASAALGGHVPLRAVMQVAGEALTISAKPFRSALSRSPTLLQLLLNDLHSTTMQSSQLVLCSARHEAEQRIARWLLLAQDWLEADQVPITHEVIGSNLGMRRAGVTEVLSRFEQAGAVRTERACITVVDREELQKLSCDCYRVISREYARLFK